MLFLELSYFNIWMCILFIIINILNRWLWNFKINISILKILILNLFWILKIDMDERLYVIFLYRILKFIYCFELNDEVFDI